MMMMVILMMMMITHRHRRCHHHHHHYCHHRQGRPLGPQCWSKQQDLRGLSEGRDHCAYGREECPEGFGNNGHLDSIPKAETFEIPKGWRVTLEHRKDSAVPIMSPVHGFETTL